MTTQSEIVKQIKDRRLFLKIKIKSLATEAKIIRNEEKKKSFLRSELREHRVGIVRHEARHTIIAYGFLRGRTYRQIEAKPLKAPDWKKVLAMVVKYGPRSSNPYWMTKQEATEIGARLEAWRCEGEHTALVETLDIRRKAA